MIRIGSRGSQLALWQANHVAGVLRNSGYDVAVEIIRTTGDRLQQVAFSQVGTKGMFTKEIEEALAAGTVDIAVHSLKDLPTELPEGFVLGGIPKRADARDAFVSERYASFAALPRGATVGTSSLRRQAQLRVLRRDLEFVEFRGNVDTRLRKLAEGQVEAIILAAAGLDRLGRTDWIRERFDPDELCPAPGQGALAIECRAEDRKTLEAIADLDDPETRFAVTAERTALNALGGSCQVPIGIYCERFGSGFRIRGMVAAPDGSRLIQARAEGTSPVDLGARLAEKLLTEGATEILAAGEALQASGLSPQPILGAP